MRKRTLITAIVCLTFFAWEIKTTFIEIHASTILKLSGKIKFHPSSNILTTTGLKGYSWNKAAGPGNNIIYYHRWKRGNGRWKPWRNNRNKIVYNLSSTLFLEPGKYIVEVKAYDGKVYSNTIRGTLRVKLPKRTTTGAEYVVKPGAIWKPIDMSSTRIKPGSALDMERFVAKGPAGKHGRVIINDGGKFAFEKQQDKRVLFFGFNMVPSANMKRSIKTKKSTEAYAECIRRQGYNLVRITFLDTYLMSGARADLEFNKEHLDRFDYLVYCLKKKGVYLYFDAMTSGDGFHKNAIFYMNGTTQLNSRMFWDPKAREHWEKGVKKLLTHYNPYTRTRLISDPIVAVLLFYNEQINGMATKLERPQFRKLWQKWLKKKYSSTENLREAWANPFGKSLLKRHENFNNISLAGHYSVKGSPRARDAGLFFFDMYEEMFNWYNRTIREMGYKGLVTYFDFVQSFSFQSVRNLTPVVSMHSYHCNPSGSGNRAGARQRSGSSIGNGGEYVQGFLASRYKNRPFFIAEYDHGYWNRYRYEEGLMIGAYSTLQDFDGLTVSHDAVEMEVNGPIDTYQKGRDPIGRASQVVIGYLFMRRDITPSHHYVELSLNRKSIIKGNWLDRVPSKFTKVAFMTGFGTAYNGNRQPSFLNNFMPNAKILPDGTGIDYRRLTSKVIDGRKELPYFVSKLKEYKILPPHNRTDPGKGIFQSDTGQILMNTKALQLEIATPRLEGVCLRANTGVKLNYLTVKKSNVRASVTVMSIDDNDLIKSKRLLLVYSTNALNSGTVFDSEDSQDIIRDHGALPVLLRTGKLHILLINKNASFMKVWALGLDGSRKEMLTFKASNDVMDLSIDTASLNYGPTPFFEIALE